MSPISNTLTLAALIACAAAAPWASPSKTTSKSLPSPTPSFCPAGKKEVILSNQDCNFENLPAGLSAAGAPVGGTIPDRYCGTYFQGFQTFAVVPGELGITTIGVVPHSGDQEIATAPQIQMTSGQPMISVNFPNSTTKNFDFNSFYFGCEIGTENSAAAPPVGCTVSIAGYAAPGNSDNEVDEAVLVCSDSVSYNPTTILGTQQMAFHTVNPACKNLQYVELDFTIDPAFAVAGADLLSVVDDVDITARQCV